MGRPGLAGRVPAPGWRGGVNPAGPAGTRRRRTWSTATSPQPAPNRLWVADATRIPCGEGVFWLAAVRDAFSNRIVGLEDLRPLRHRPDPRPRSSTASGRATSATASSSTTATGGRTTRRFRFSQRLQDNGILPSMGSIGDSLRQRADGELLVDAEDRTGLPHEPGGPATRPRTRSSPTSTPGHDMRVILVLTGP